MAASHNHEHILKEPHNTGRRSGSARCEVLGVTFRNENLVTKSCPPYSIVGGVPARLIKMRFTPEQVANHERLL